MLDLRRYLKYVILFSFPTDVINLSGKIRIRKSRYYGEEAM